jgi:hypothetical protein
MPKATATATSTSVIIVVTGGCAQIRVIAIVVIIQQWLVDFKLFELIFDANRLDLV